MGRQQRCCRPPDRQLDGALTYAWVAGSDLVVYHGARIPIAGGTVRDRLDDEERSLRRALRRAAALGVRLAIENLAPVYPGPELVCHDPSAVAGLVRRLDSEHAGMCLDIGHVHIAAELAGCGLLELIDPVLERVILFHVHDNLGARTRAPIAAASSLSASTFTSRPERERCPGRRSRRGWLRTAPLCSSRSIRPDGRNLERWRSSPARSSGARHRKPGPQHNLNFGHRANDRLRPRVYIFPAMGVRPPQIMAFGGGGFSMEWGNTLLDDHVLALTGVERPRVCFLPTASGDADHYVVRFYRAFPASRCEPSHISLFRRETGVGDPRAHLLAQDLIYVGGGSLVSLLGTWRAHGIDLALREAWDAGVVLCGGSAGSLCWFADSVSAFHEGPARCIEGLGFLPWSNAVHYEEEAERRSAFHDAIAAGMVPGYGASDGAALHFAGKELSEVVSSRPGARAVHVSRDADGAIVERGLAVRYLGATPAAVREGEAIAA